MITNDIYHQKLISDYIEHGFAPIPIHYKSKQPVNKGWPNLKIGTNDIGEYFGGQPTNIGIVTGKPSQGLVDIDIDDAAALTICSVVFAKDEMHLWSSIEAKISLGLSSSEA